MTVWLVLENGMHGQVSDCMAGAGEWHREVSDCMAGA